MNLNQKKQLYSLLNALREDVLTDEQFSDLEHLVSNDSEAAQEYVLYVKLWTDLQFFRAANSESNIMPTPDLESFENTEFWQAMANYEKHAPKIEVHKEKPQRQLIQKVVYPPREKRKVSKFNIIFLAMNAAAMLFFFLFLKFAPSKNGVEVATLTDSINAEWVNADVSMQRGARLYSDKTPVLLREGLVEIKFDNNAQVTIEGPAEFQIIDGDMIKLNYGQLYSQVPPEAYGFQIGTQHAKVIDLGTEFGIKEEIDGDIEVHVLKGRINLISNVLSKKINVNLLSGSARELNTATGELKEIPCKDNLFARQIDSKINIIWRGQRQVDLADIVGGGNGFGSGKLECGINPETGVLAYRDRDLIQDSFFQGFTAVTENSFVDSVFCPFKDNSSIQVSTMNHIFNQCPLTTGTHWGYVMNSGWYGQTSRVKDAFNGNLQLDGQVYGSKEFPAIAIHSNMGITFDLDVIRRSIGMFKLNRFSARCGISELVTEKGGFSFEPKASFYVLLDGQKQFEQVDMTPSIGAAEINLPIPDDVRFLTLMVTEGSDRTYDGDWTLFANPKLHLVRAE